MPSTNDYKPILLRLLSFLDNQHYEKGHVFTQQRLNEIKPDDVRRWMCVQTYHTPEPEADADPLYIRANTLQYWKKAISHFMPNSHMSWNVISQVGNPTRSPQINKLIRAVRKKEVRKQGAPSKARRPLTLSEFRMTHSRLRKNETSRQEDLIVKFGLPALMAFQFSMISRVDCTCQWKTESLGRHDHFPDQALKAKLELSKNDMEERDAPWQTLLGAMDPTFCVFANVGLWLEVQFSTNAWASQSPYVFSFNDDFHVPRGGIKAKKRLEK